jgi:hypothetical protein
MIRILIKILTAGPLLHYLGEKTNGYKTIIGIVGLVCTLIAYIASALHPGLIDPAVLPPQDLETVLNAALAAFGALTAGGGIHKAVKRRRRRVREGDVAEEDLPSPDERAEVNRQLDDLRERIADWERPR